MDREIQSKRSIFNPASAWLHWMKRYWWIGLIVIIAVFLIVNLFSKDTHQNNIASEEFECPSRIFYKDNTSYALYPDGERQISEDSIEKIRNSCPKAEIQSNNNTANNNNNNNNSAETQKSSITYPSLSLITPFLSESDIDRAGPFSTRSDIEHVIMHNGIDFMTQKDKTSFRAAADGIVTFSIYQNEKTGNWQVNLMIDHNPWVIIYSFEPMTSSEADGNTQLGYITVKNNQEVKAGDELGKLLVIDPESTHVHFGVNLNDISVCPESYFTLEAKESIMRLLHNFNSEYNMCYE